MPAVLAERGMVGQIATRGVPVPVQAGRRWPVERTHAWGNQDGKLRWCTERRRLVVEFWLALGRRHHRAWSIGASRLGLLPLGRPPTTTVITPPGAAPQPS